MKKLADECAMARYGCPRQEAVDANPNQSLFVAAAAFRAVQQGAAP